MKSNEQTDLTNKTETDSQTENRLTAGGGEGRGWRDGAKLEKGLMDMDISMVIAEGGHRRGINGMESIR